MNKEQSLKAYDKEVKQAREVLRETKEAAEQAKAQAGEIFMEEEQKAWKAHKERIKEG